jgi:hypothetical protein
MGYFFDLEDEVLNGVARVSNAESHIGRQQEIGGVSRPGIENFPSPDTGCPSLPECPTGRYRAPIQEHVVDAIGIGGRIKTD